MRKRISAEGWSAGCAVSGVAGSSLGGLGRLFLRLRRGMPGSIMAVFLPMALLAVYSGSPFLAPAYMQVNQEEPEESETEEPEEAAGAPAAAEPAGSEHCKAAILIDARTGTILYEHDAHTPYPPASMVKMMTGYVAMKLVQEGKFSLDDMVPVSAQASKMGGSQVYLKQGEQFRLEDMLKAVMICSANDASYAIAEYMGGSIPGFLDLMRFEAAQLNMKETELYSVHGLPPGNQREEDKLSAYDLALLGRAIVQHAPKLLEYASIEQAPFREGAFIMQNVNKMMKRFKGMDGIKTGYYKRAGFSITATAARDGKRYIAVVMGCDKSRNRFNEAARLLNMGFNLFDQCELAKKGAQFESGLPVINGVADKVNLVFADDLVVILKRSEKDKIQKQLNLTAERLEAPVTAGAVVGQVTFKLDDHELGAIPLLTGEDVEALSFLQRIGKALGF